MVAQCILGANTALASPDVQRQIRVDTVKNMCELHRTMLKEMIKMRGTPGYTDQVLYSVAESEKNPTVKSFLERVTGELASRSSKDRAFEFLESTEQFMQPCYNAMAKAYDNTVTQYQAGSPAPPQSTPPIPGEQLQQTYTEPKQETYTGPNNEPQAFDRSTSGSSYINQRR